MNYKIKPEDKKAIIELFLGLVKIKDIADKYKVSGERIRQILKQYLDKDLIYQVKQTRKKVNARQARIRFRERYATDAKFREEIRRKNLNRYYLKKYGYIPQRSRNK